MLKSVDKTSYKLCTRKSANLTYLKIWDCDSYVKKLMSNKLDAKYDKCVFAVYPKQTKWYHCFYLIDNKVFVVCFGIFLEREFILKSTSGRNFEHDEVLIPFVTINVGQDDVPHKMVKHLKKVTPILLQHSKPPKDA